GGTSCQRFGDRDLVQVQKNVGQNRRCLLFTVLDGHSRLTLWDDATHATSARITGLHLRPGRRHERSIVAWIGGWMRMSSFHTRPIEDEPNHVRLPPDVPFRSAISPQRSGDTPP
ncbi:hypothetical protein, partial [Methylobacterium bullatum]|uniref:hypothetical protein n=1 Tax=Methylobacterium bullatum TaxID=570505 RepID=UPI001AEEDFD1